MTLDEVVQAFSRSHHRGFPVVDNGTLVGIITQTDLTNITQRQTPGDTPLSQIMTPKPMTVSPSASLADVLYLLNRYQLSRLPVTEARKLVGIITRSDLIRAEADQLSGSTVELGPRPEPSYVVYQTRSPAIGKGRLLVPLANPQTSQSLLRMAAAIARDRDYELECIQIILVPRHKSPADTAVNTTKSRRLLRQAESLGRQWKLPIHTQIRVAHDVAQAILETIKERHIDLILMGWNGTASTPGRIFGNVVDTLIRQAACEVVLVKLGNKLQPQKNARLPSFPATHERVLDLGLEKAGEGEKPIFQHPKWNRWLVPMGGGPNTQQAIKLLPALIVLGTTPQIRLCQIFEPSQSVRETPILDQAVDKLRRQIQTRKGMSLRIPVLATHIRGHSVPEAVTKLAQADECDVVVVGASREGLLQQVIQGNIPEAIARGCQCTVILVRCALT